MDCGSKFIEDLIENKLEHFYYDDAKLLAEAYHNRADNERSLLVLAHCLTQARGYESAYHLLRTVSNPTAGAALNTAKCRYLFAHCAFMLNRVQEAEQTLRGTSVSDQLQLHPCFTGTVTLPYAHSLLARILCETNRVESARTHWAQAIRLNPLLWSAVRSYCDVGGEKMVELLQPSLDELAEWKSANNIIDDLIESKEQDNTGERGQRLASKIASGRIKNSSASVNLKTLSSAAPSSPIGNPAAAQTAATTIIEKRRTRLRAADNRLTAAAAASIALRASENSPLTRSSKLVDSTSPGSGGALLLIEQQKQQDEKEQLLLQQLKQQTVGKRITRRTANATAIAAVSATSQKLNQDNIQIKFNEKSKGNKIYYELLEWITQLARVQECLSRFRCIEALSLLNKIDPQFLQMPLTLELRARIFFENGEYRRCCQIFDEIRRLYPRRVQGMEIYSTALWQMHDTTKLSALASEMADVARDQPETWCIAGNCFSLEKQHETAIECLERSIRLNHRFDYAYSILGHELIDMNDLVRAEQAFRKAIVYAPNDYRAWYGLGLVHFKEEKIQLARVNLQRAVQINPTNTVLLCQLAVIEQSLHCTDLAMQYLERALKQQPNNVACRFHKARLLFDTGCYEEAKTELEELKVLSPDEAHVFFLLGRVNRKLGNTHLALLNFSMATEIDPRGEQNQSVLTTNKEPYDDEPI
uniref:Cell division cycle protein 27 homolog n=1 Tax=Meloidogyne javanica TaxID=6303 RepID=A0A915LFL0_MELJA